MTANRKKRIQQELQELTEEPIPNFSILGPVNGDLFLWEVTLEGPVRSPYEGGIFRLSIQFPDNYPLQPPELRFVTKIYHCNISADGSICGLDDLEDTNYKPSLCIGFLLLDLYDLLQDPNLSATKNTQELSDLSQQYIWEPTKYNYMARQWTRQYAAIDNDDDNDDNDMSSSSYYESSSSSNTDYDFPILASDYRNNSIMHGRYDNNNISRVDYDFLPTDARMEDLSSSSSSLERILAITSSSADKNNNKKKEKSVSFSLRKRIRNIHHLSLMSEKPIEEFWYRPKDIAAIKTSAQHMVTLIEDEDEDNQSEEIIRMESARGLEHMMKEDARERFVQKRCAYNAVLNEQTRQRKESIKEADHSIIAQLYQDSNKKCTDVALKRAELDEQAVKDYLADARKEELERLSTLYNMTQEKNELGAHRNNAGVVWKNSGGAMIPTTAPCAFQLSEC